MKEQKAVVLVLLQVLVLFLGLCESSMSSAPYVDQVHNRRKSMLTEPTSSLLLNRFGSSIVFPLFGNVYPIGYAHIIYMLYIFLLPHENLLFPIVKKKKKKKKKKLWGINPYI